MERKSVCTQQLIHIVYPLVSLFRKKNSCAVLTWIISCLGNKSGCFLFLMTLGRTEAGDLSRTRGAGPQTAALTLCDMLCFCACYWLISYLTSPTGMSASWEQGFLHVWLIFYIPSANNWRRKEINLSTLSTHTHTHTHTGTRTELFPFLCVWFIFYTPSANNWRRKETHLPTLSSHTDTHKHNCSPQRIWKSSPQGKYRCWWRE